MIKEKNILVVGAGGFIADWQGEPLNLKSDGRIIATGEQALLETVCNLLNR